MGLIFLETNLTESIFITISSTISIIEYINSWNLCRLHVRINCCVGPDNWKLVATVNDLTPSSLATPKLL